MIRKLMKITPFNLYIFHDEVSLKTSTSSKNIVYKYILFKKWCVTEFIVKTFFFKNGLLHFIFNLYCILYITLSSLKSNNVSFMFYNYIQCVFFSNSIIFLNKRHMYFSRDWGQNGHFLFKSRQKGHCHFKTLNSSSPFPIDHTS